MSSMRPRLCATLHGVPHQSGLPDAVQLMTAFILPDYQGQGLGRVMVQTVAKDLLRRGFKAIEAFGDARWKEPPVCSRPTICSLSASRRSGSTLPTPGCVWS